MMIPKVSIVVPAYNNAGSIRETLESILAQKYQNFEVIVADHSSTDGTADIVQQYVGNPHLRVLRPTQTGGGAAANWGRVCGHANGELLKLVCGDDLIEPDALAAQVAALDAHPSAVLVASPRRVISARGRVIVSRRGLAGLRGLVPGRHAIKTTVRAGTNVFGEPACVLFRRGALEAVGGWDSRFPYLIDEATYVKLLMQGDMVALPKVLAAFRVSGGQWSVRLAREQAAQVRAFHAALLAEHRGLVSVLDVALGDVRAVAMSYARRLVYAWLRLRGRLEVARPVPPEHGQ